MKKLTTKEFIEKAKQIHGDKYNYSMVEYINSHINIIINCSIHGNFSQKPNNHLNGKGCSKCKNGVKYTKEIFIEKSNIIHNNFYNYSKIKYSNSKHKIEIICPKHGSFWQTPANHIQNRGCPTCKNEKLSIFFKKDISNMIQNFKKIHKNKYTYPELNFYKNNRDKINIFCKNHGIFIQSIRGHLIGQGCPKCSCIISKPEIEVQEFIKSLNYTIKTNIRNIIKPYELDIYIPELNKAIEFNGEYWHYNNKNLKRKPKGYHIMKSNLCDQKGIKLLHLREDLWKKDKEKMKKVIEKFLYYKK